MITKWSNHVCSDFVFELIAHQVNCWSKITYKASNDVKGAKHILFTKFGLVKYPYVYVTPFL